MTRKYVSRRTVLLALPALTVTTTGCFGSFSMTRSMHGWIGSWKSKWLSELGFLGFLIIGAYGVTTLVDALVLNAIEFFTGKPVFDNKYSNGKINTLTGGGGGGDDLDLDLGGDDGKKKKKKKKKRKSYRAGEEQLVLEDNDGEVLRVRHEAPGGPATDVEIRKLRGGGFALVARDGHRLACASAESSGVVLRDGAGVELARIGAAGSDDLARVVDEGGSISVALLTHLATSDGLQRIAAARRSLGRV